MTNSVTWSHDKLSPHFSRVARAVCMTVLCALLGVGCATSMRVQVQSSKDTNDGKPLYMLVRAVDSRALVSESYADASALVFTTKKDPTVKHVQAIMPGTEINVTIPTPESSDVALYFFYTQPGDQWRIPLTQPLPSDIVVELGSNQIERASIRRK